MLVILSFKKSELLMTFPSKSIILHFVRQFSVVNWFVKGAKIFCSMISLDSFLAIPSKFLMIPKAN